jgi:hypothetical protein
MKKIPSFPSLNSLKELTSIKDSISTRIFYSTFLNKITDEFIEDAPYNIISNVQSSLDDDNFINTITYGNITTSVGFSMGIFGSNSHIKNIMLFMFLYFIWFKMQNSIYVNFNKLNNKIGNYIDTKTIQKNTNLIVVVLFIILTRNVENAI